MEQPSFQKDELDRLKSSYHPNPEFTKTLKQQDKLNKDTVLKLLEQGFDPNDNGAYCEFPYFLQSEDQETFEVLRDFGANTDLSKLDPTLINDAHLINYQFYDLYESFILALRPGTFAMVTELSKLQWLKSKGFDFNIPPFMKLQTFSLKTPWTVLVSPTSYNLPDVTSFLVNETNLDFNLELVLEDTKIKGRFLNWHFYAFNILANEYRPVNDRKKDLESFIALLGNKIDIHSKTSEGRNIYFILPFIKSAQAKEAAKILMDMGITPYEKDHSERSFVDCFKGDKNMNAAIQLIETNKDKISVVPKKADNQAIETEQKKVESAVDQPDTNTKGKPVIEPVMLDEKETGHQSETPDQAFLPFQNKLKAFVSLLESYQKDNISEVEALSFIKEAAKEGLNSDDIDAIMVKLNQGSRRFGLMRVKKFLNAAERYLETMNKENEYEDVVLDNHGKKTKCSLSLELLPVILNDHGDRFDQRINLENLFDLDSTIVKSIIEESGKHKKIVKFVYYASRSYRLTKDNEEQSIYDVGILFDDGMYRTWHDQKSHMADQVKTVMDIDYYVGNDGFLYQYSDTSNEFLVVPGIDNIEEVWYERYFTLDHLKFVYRHKITKKLISIGYPEDDYLTGVINPVKVCLYQKIRSVLDKDGIRKYRDKNN